MAEMTLKVEHVRAAVREIRLMCHRMTDLADMLDARLEGSETAGEQHKRIIAAFVELWSKRYGRAYVFAGGKDAMAVKRLLKVLDPDEIITRATRYISNDDPFYVKVQHSLSMFASTINQHGAAGPTDAGSASELAAAVDCKHRPKCKSDVEHTRKMLAELRG